MRSVPRKVTALVVCSILMIMAEAAVSNAQTAALPIPVAVFMGQEPYQANGRDWIRYRYLIANFEAYPNELFAAAPALPPCGLNKRASRTWVDFFDSRGKRLNGFCALGNHDNLGKLWFAVESGIVPPSWVYIEMTDRATGNKYKSDLVETTQ